MIINHSSNEDDTFGSAWLYAAHDASTAYLDELNTGFKWRCLELLDRPKFYIGLPEQHVLGSSSKASASFDHKQVCCLLAHQATSGLLEATALTACFSRQRCNGIVLVMLKGRIFRAKETRGSLVIRMLSQALRKSPTIAQSDVAHEDKTLLLCCYHWP